MGKGPKDPSQAARKDPRGGEELRNDPRDCARARLGPACANAGPVFLGFLAFKLPCRCGAVYA